MTPKNRWLSEVDPDALVRTLVEAIRIPSPSGSEREMGEYCAARMRAMGLEVTEAALRPESPNFVGRLSGSRPGITLCFHAHLDTVPPGDLSAWTKDPFAGIAENGRVFGRGACDVKNDIAVMLTVAGVLAARREEWRGNLVLCLASGEETADPAGTEHVIREGLLGGVDFAVVGEQTECGVAVAHRGGVHLRVSARGKSAHSSIADRAGVNAIYQMSRVVEAIRSRYLPALRTRRHPSLPAPTATVSMIQGGVKPNVVPDRCEMVMDRRTLPHETPEAVRAEIAALLEDLRRENPDLIAEVGVLRAMAPFETDARNPCVQSLLRAASRVLGSPQGPVGYVAGTDARLFPPAGIPAAVFGPGEFSEAHAADESVSIDQLLKAAHILTLLAADLLGDPPA
ncbi:MAG: M20 family metallopeptidase [Candidatus Tectomicrobia bacterium]|nr:M20 family metallopeptidase [Candidatus Tectomicrobia bacterium]